MANEAYIVCNSSNGSRLLTDCVSFRFVKERYTPYTYLEGVWHIDEAISDEIVSLSFSLNGNQLHFGYPSGVESCIVDGKRVLKVRSKGYTEALGRNQPTAGLLTNVNLIGLATSAITCPNISYEENTPTASYVNYYDGTSIWDAVVCYALRTYGLYPYISGTNTVRISRPATPSAFYCSSFVSKGCGTDYSNAVSIIASPDVAGNADTYLLGDSELISRNIVRRRDIPFDREWIMDPEAGLRAKINFSKRAIRYDCYSVVGYLGYDLLDYFVDQKSNTVSEISKLVITGGSDKPIMSQVWCYHDAYCA